MNELQNRIEAILFASGKGVTEEELVKYCQEDNKAIKKALSTLQQDLEKREGSLIISLHNNRWKMTVRGKYLRDVESIVSETELPSPILKTLAVIAFKSPVLQADVINMRGQGAYDHVKELVKQKFVTKEERGRSFLLKITDKFYNYFDVEGDEEIQEVFAKLREKQQTLGDLQIIDTLPEEEKTTTQQDQEQKEQLGELEIVPIVPKTKERSAQDIAEEKDFLQRIDEGIQAISERVQKNELPKRKETEETTEQRTEAKEENIIAEEKKQKETEENPLKVLEALAEKKEEEKEEDYL